MQFSGNTNNRNPKLKFRYFYLQIQKLEQTLHKIHQSFQALELEESILNTSQDEQDDNNINQQPSIENTINPNFIQKPNQISNFNNNSQNQILFNNQNNNYSNFPTSILPNDIHNINKCPKPISGLNINSNTNLSNNNNPLPILSKQISKNIKNNQKKQQASSIVIINNQKQYQCLYCQKVFETHRKLGGHRAKGHKDIPSLKKLKKMQLGIVNNQSDAADSQSSQNSNNLQENDNAVVISENDQQFLHYENNHETDNKLCNSNNFANFNSYNCNVNQDNDIFLEEPVQDRHQQHNDEDEEEQEENYQQYNLDHYE